MKIKPSNDVKMYGLSQTKWVGKIYLQQELGNKNQLCKEILEHKLYVYKKCVRKINPSTGK